MAETLPRTEEGYPVRVKRGLTRTQTAIRGLEAALSDSIHHLERGHIWFGRSVICWHEKHFYIAALLSRQQAEYYLIYDAQTRRIKHFTGQNAYKTALDYLTTAMKYDADSPPERAA